MFPRISHCVGLLAACLLSHLPCSAQEGENVTLRFLSFPLAVDPAPVEFLVGEGKTQKVEIPTNELSSAHKVKRMATWAVGETVEDKEGKKVFKVYGQAPALASDDQIILLIRKGTKYADGFDLIPINGANTDFGRGKLLFLNAAKVEIAGVVGATKFAVKPGRHAVIRPKGDSEDGGLFHAEIFYRKGEVAKPFFSSTWPISNASRAMIFIYHDPDTMRLRLHTVRDFPE